MSLLITVPDLRRGGGVAHYYDRLAPHLPAETHLFVIGRRLGESGALSAGARLVRDGAGLWRGLGEDDEGVLIVNPSLDLRSLVRDGAVVQAARARGRRVIVFVRGWQDDTERTIDSRAGRSFVAPLLGADAVIVLAGRFRAALRRWGYRGPVHTATTAVADDALDAGDATAGASGGRDGPLSVLFLSRVRADKGVYEALEAVRLAQQRGLALRVSVAGDGPDLPRATVLEAMAYGMGVITCAVGGLQDFFVDGEHGLLAPDAHPPTLADRLETLARDDALRRRVGLSAQRFAREHFTARRAAERLLDVVAQVRQASAGVAAPDTDWFAGSGAPTGEPERVER
jgi:glycosyltransferase involved in cell wall biosynthesis